MLLSSLLPSLASTSSLAVRHPPAPPAANIPAVLSAMACCTSPDPAMHAPAKEVLMSWGDTLPSGQYGYLSSLLLIIVGELEGGSGGGPLPAPPIPPAVRLMEAILLKNAVPRAFSSPRSRRNATATAHHHQRNDNKEEEEEEEERQLGEEECRCI